MRPVTVSVGPLAAASATNIRTASAAPAGAIVLNGTLVSAGASFYNIPQGQRIAVPSGQALLDSPRQIRFTTAASEAGKTVLLTGLDRQGNVQSETIALPSSATTVDSVLSYAVLQSAVISSTSNNNISIGTNGVSESQWVRLDNYISPGNVFLQVDVTGTVNYTVRQTGDDPDSPTDPVAAASVFWADSADSAVVAKTASAQSSYTIPPTYVKIVLNSGTGSLTMSVSQTGVNAT